MDHRFHRPINAVHFRQRVQRTLNYAVWGLCIAALVAPLSPILAAAIFCVSVVIGFVRPHSFSSATRLIDQHYHFKDRTLTAFALLRHTHRTPMQQLQIEDAAEHITAVRPQAVYPIRLPKMFWAAVGLFALNYVGTAIWHNRFQQPTDPIESVLHTLPIEQVVLREEIVAPTEELVQKHPGEQPLLTLSERLEMLLDKFDPTRTDAKESLMTLSEMEEAFQTAIDALQLETMDELLQELAKTLELAEQTLPISKALEKGEYRQATWELKKLDAEALESLTKPERTAMAEQMRALAESAEQQNQKPLQEAAQKMSDTLENGDNESGKSAAEALANEVEKHSIRTAVGKDLSKQQMKLGMMKADSGLAMSGGKQTDKTKTASETWGSGAAGDPNAGQETQLQGQRQQETLTGMLSEQGDTVTEIIDSQAMTAADSRRQYREQYQNYQKISESVLDSEPIPLGQRQIIRRYFESIRPGAE